MNAKSTGPPYLSLSGWAWDKERGHRREQPCCFPVFVLTGQQKRCLWLGCLHKAGFRASCFPNSEFLPEGKDVLRLLKEAESSEGRLLRRTYRVSHLWTESSSFPGLSLSSITSSLSKASKWLRVWQVLRSHGKKQALLGSATQAGPGPWRAITILSAGPSLRSPDQTKPVC